MKIAIQDQIINPASLLRDTELTAMIPQEMVNAQQQLITWCDSKLYVLKLELKDLSEATDHAKKMKWKFSTLQSQVTKSLKRISYYEKIKAALLEGYYIVPNFPISMFAIRTKKNYPEKDYSNSYWDNHEQESQELKIDSGDYKNPFPISYTKTFKDEKGEEKKQYYAGAWDDFEFPVTMAKPSIMQATSRAMALKIFDQIGIMPAEKKQDPVIIGQIKLKTSYSFKVVSFMIAWHLNTNVL